MNDPHVHHWLQLRDHAIQLFGDTPGAALEETILEHFNEQPQRVADLIDQIGGRVKTGKVKSGWPILRRELERKPADSVATDTLERAKQLKLAETWIDQAGGYIDDQQELLDELFNERGRLRHWPDLKPAIVAHWLEQRPRFIQAEADSLAYQLRAAESYRRIRAMTRHADGDQAADEHASLIAKDVERQLTAREDPIAW
jgi:hypothetical protein